jgi:hypothetical protein
MTAARIHRINVVDYVVAVSWVMSRCAELVGYVAAFRIPRYAPEP